MSIDLLSAGAAKGLVEALQAALVAATGTDIAGTFGAVGAIRAQFEDGADCDVLILTAPMLDDLARAGHVDGNTIAPLGRVYTGIAVRSGDAHPAIAERASLRASLAAATALYCPDTERATAGIHFVRVLRKLALWPGAAARLRTYPSGAVAMREMGAARESGVLGCTQVTEILYTPGVELVGPLPPEFELATVYAVAVSMRARNPELARRFAAMLVGTDARATRERGGFSAAAGG